MTLRSGRPLPLEFAPPRAVISSDDGSRDGKARRIRRGHDGGNLAAPICRQNSLKRRNRLPEIALKGTAGLLLWHVIVKTV